MAVLLLAPGVVQVPRAHVVDEAAAARGEPPVAIAAAARAGATLLEELAQAALEQTAEPAADFTAAAGLAFALLR